MKRLERSRSSRVLFGVCGGFGEYFDLDADVVRVLWIVSILLGGIGILPYVAAILLMPESDAEERASEGEGAGRYLGLVLIALAALLFLRLLDVPGFGLGIFTLWTWQLILPVILFVGGALLVWPKLRSMAGIPSKTKIRRSVGNRVFAGVAGGLAQATETDPNLVRIGFVLATTLTSGLAIPVYLLLILILPEEEVVLPPVEPIAPEGPPSPSPPDPPREGAPVPPDPPPADPPREGPPAPTAAPAAGPGPASGEREAPPSDQAPAESDR